MNILVLTSVSMPGFTAEELKRVEEAAGGGSTVMIADSEDAALKFAPEADVVFGFVSPELLAAAPNLRWVHAAASGVNRYLYPAFRESDVLLTSAKGLVGNPLADHAFALLLALTRRVATAVRMGPESWNHRRELRLVETELDGQIMGIIGLGGTGRALGRRAVGFGMHCIAVDRDKVPAAPEVNDVWGLDRLDELLEIADVVAVCCPLTEETHNLISERELKLMKPSAYLVNVTRGEIIDADALVEALTSGEIAGAGLDVTPEEPLPADHALWQLDNVVMTPHSAGASQERAGRGIDRFCKNLVLFREGELLEGLIDMQAGF
jgi:phosphoglycerate dehydrogenase-like enzyme